MGLESAFRELRAAWFSHVLADNGLEREWEKQEARRKATNAEARKRYDEQTEAIIAGNASIRLAPRCMADLDAAKRWRHDHQRTH